MVLFSYFRELHVDLLPELAVTIHDMKSEGMSDAVVLSVAPLLLLKGKKKKNISLQWKWKFHLYCMEKGVFGIT